MVSEVNFAGRMLFLYNGFWDLINYAKRGHFQVSVMLYNDYSCRMNVPVPYYLQIVTEDSVMHSYVVIDNKGNVLDNFNDNYVIVGNLLKEPFDEVMDKYNISNTSLQVLVEPVNWCKK